MRLPGSIPLDLQNKVRDAVIDARRGEFG